MKTITFFEKRKKRKVGIVFSYFSFSGAITTVEILDQFNGKEDGTIDATVNELYTMKLQIKNLINFEDLSFQMKTEDGNFVDLDITPPVIFSFFFFKKNNQASLTLREEFFDWGCTTAPCL